MAPLARARGTAPTPRGHDGRSRSIPRRRAASRSRRRLRARTTTGGTTLDRCCRAASVSKRIRAQLEVHDLGQASLAAFHEPWGAITTGGPQAAALPSRIRIIDAPIESLGVEAQGIGDAQHDHFAVLEGDEAVVEIAGRHRNILAEAERVVLVDPRVVTRFGTVVADAFEPGARVLVERPTLGAMIARCRRSVEWPLALAPIKAADVATPKRYPNDTLLVDVPATRAESWSWDVVDL